MDMQQVVRCMIALCGVLIQTGAIAARKTVQCRADEMEHAGRCVPCPQCQVGTGLRDICGYGQGSGLTCEPCEKGSYNSKPGPHKCLPCLDCQYYHRETVYKCRSVINTECGACEPHYFESFADMRDSGSVLYPCSHCREDPAHPECAAYRHSMSSPAPSTASSPPLTTDQPTTGAALSAGHSILLTVLISLFALLLLLVTACGVCLYVKMRLQHGGKRRADVQIAEAVEMQELMDHEREDGRRRAHLEMLDVEAADRDERHVFERNVEVHKRQPNAPPMDHPDQLNPALVDINQNTIPDKALQHKNVHQLLNPATRSFSDPGPSYSHQRLPSNDPGLVSCENPGTSGATSLQPVDLQQTVVNDECGVAATIAKKIHDCISSVPGADDDDNQAARSMRIGDQLAATIPKVSSYTQGVVQNAIVGAVPTVSHRVAVVNPISVGALKDAINSAMNGPPCNRSRSEPEHLVEYTPESSTDGEEEDDDATISLIESEASTLMLAGREPEENYDPSDARNALPVHRNLLPSIEDNAARSVATQRSSHITPPRRRMPDIESGGDTPTTISGSDPEPGASPNASGGLGQSPQINITINCNHTNAAASTPVTPMYGAPTFINNNDCHHSYSPSDTNTPSTGNTNTPPSDRQPDITPNTQPGSSSDPPDSADDETTPKTSSLTSGMFDTILIENRHVQMANYPPTCRQSVQLPCASSHFPVQETLYHI